MTRDKQTRFARTIRRAILSGRFNYENHLMPGTWYGYEIQTQPMFASYGQIGFSVFGRGLPEVTWDWELKQMEFDEMSYKDYLDYDED